MVLIFFVLYNEFRTNSINFFKIDFLKENCLKLILFSFFNLTLFFVQMYLLINHMLFKQNWHCIPHHIWIWAWKSDLRRQKKNRHNIKDNIKVKSCIDRYTTSMSNFVSKQIFLLINIIYIILKHYIQLYGNN